MIVSMTGFGTGSAKSADAAATVEIRTVNHRFLDVHVRLAREYSFLEAAIQLAVRQKIGRGRVDVSVAIQGPGPSAFQVDSDAARSYVEAAARLREEFRMEDALDVKTLLALPGVLQSRDSSQSPSESGEIPELLAQGLQQALEGVARMRRQEGEALYAEMKGYLENIGDGIKRMQAISPATVVEYRKKLEDRLALLLPQNSIEPQRLAQEVALMAERSDISEEIARLESHVGQHLNLIDAGMEVGKKLDFLLQEMQREVNTILSKSANLEITRLGIAVKADIEKLREQAQNIE